MQSCVFAGRDVIEVYNVMNAVEWMDRVKTFANSHQSTTLTNPKQSYTLLRLKVDIMGPFKRQFPIPTGAQLFSRLWHGGGEKLPPSSCIILLRWRTRGGCHLLCFVATHKPVKCMYVFTSRVFILSFLHRAHISFQWSPLLTDL